MNILFTASECVPFIKTGGLADVIGSLPKALRDQGEQVCVILPLYKKHMQRWQQELRHRMYFYINLGWRRQYCGIEEIKIDGIRYIFLDNEYYFGRDSIYGYSQDECERFSFFCRAVLEAIPHIDFSPDIIHCNDWQTGMIPALLKTQYHSLTRYKQIKTIYTIHNLRYQGLFSIGEVKELFGLDDAMFSAQTLEFYGGASFMKAGLLYSDAITTVSPNYANEIKTPYFGERLDGVITQRTEDLFGIINGLDMDSYDPAYDDCIVCNYDCEHIAKKSLNKRALQKECGLQEDITIPVISMVTRLTGQKGLDLVEYALDQLMQLGVQFVVLGTGEERYVNLLKWAQWRYPNQLSVHIQMDFAKARRIYAGSDLFLMPSQFEPCGLSQLIAMRYGTLPIVRETGGLKDTVVPYNEQTGEGTGFSFFSYNADDMMRTIRYAVSLYRNERTQFDHIIEKAMRCDFSWAPSAKHYVELYQRVISKE